MEPGSMGMGNRAGWRSLLVFLAFAGIALFFLLSEHRVHALSWLPLIFLAACPILHMFMHGGHGGHGGGHEGHGSARRERPIDPVPSQASEKI